MVKLIRRRRTVNKTIQRLDLCGCACVLKVRVRVCVGCGVVCGVRLVSWCVVCGCVWCGVCGCGVAP